MAHALELLDRHGDDARVLAGGQSLMPTLNMRLAQPELLIDINALDALRGISCEVDASGPQVRIGALTRHVETLGSPIVREHLPLIAQAMPHVGHVAIRNLGTFGGSIALADPAAELPACALALGATFVLESVAGRREVAAEDFFLGLFETERQPNELLTGIRISAQPPGFVAVFRELSQRHGDFALAGVAALVKMDDRVIAESRLAYFATEDRPTLAVSAMAAVRGATWSGATKEALERALGNDLAPLESLAGDAETKLQWQCVLTERALSAAVGDAPRGRARAG